MNFSKIQSATIDEMSFGVIPIMEMVQGIASFTARNAIIFRRNAQSRSSYPLVELLLHIFGEMQKIT